MKKILIVIAAALLISCDTTPDPPQKEPGVKKHRPYPDSTALGKPRPYRPNK